MLWLLAQATPQLPPSIRLPNGIELTGPSAVAKLQCVSEEDALLDHLPKKLTEDQRHFSIEFSAQDGQQATYKDFYYRNAMPIAWTSNAEKLSFYLTMDSQERHGEVWFTSEWREDGKIAFKSLVTTTSKNQSFKPLVLDRSGNCELLIDMHPDTKQ